MTSLSTTTLYNPTTSADLKSCPSCNLVFVKSEQLRYQALDLRAVKVWRRISIVEVDVGYFPLHAIRLLSELPNSLLKRGLVLVHFILFARLET